MSKVIKQFAQKWGMEEPTVLAIYRLIESYGSRYGKSAKALKGFNINLSVRQIRYFYRKARLHERIEFDRKGRPNNYRDMLRKL